MQGNGSPSVIELLLSLFPCSIHDGDSCDCAVTSLMPP